jgi:lipopolysaccharide transport system ATP-binding protein
MANDVVIRAEGLGKKYMIGHAAERERYVALRDVLVRGAHNLWHKTADMVRSRTVVAGDMIDEFWALKDVNFEVRQGEVLGIIGRNGAGKSTLLKILSRITEPTEGRVRLRGRVGSLLEVGTGFHPELTGRENIYLNGAILGMTRREIAQKFDEIVAFAEVEKFLDTPVKRYSSGMYVRLAFAVAAHLEPEILIVDEVLAVGDVEFQRKCLGKMDEVSRREGRTVLFVSHNMATISELADRAVLLEKGSVAIDGTLTDVLSTYLLAGGERAVYIYAREEEYESPHLARVEVLTSYPGGVHQFGEALEIRFEIRHGQPLDKGCFSFQIINQYAQPVIHAFAYYPDVIFGDRSNFSEIRCIFPNLLLNVGGYHLRTFLSGPPRTERYESLDNICPFEVVREDPPVLWGWRPEVCTYHEDYKWKVVALGDQKGPPRKLTFEGPEGSSGAD